MFCFSSFSEAIISPNCHRIASSIPVPVQEVAGDNQHLSVESPTLFSFSIFKQLKLDLGHSLGVTLQHTVGFWKKTAFYHAVTRDVLVLKEPTHKILIAVKTRQHSLAWSTHLQSQHLGCGGAAVQGHHSSTVTLKPPWAKRALGRLTHWFRKKSWARLRFLPCSTWDTQHCSPATATPLEGLLKPCERSRVNWNFKQIALEMAICLFDVGHHSQVPTLSELEGHLTL